MRFMEPHVMLCSVVYTSNQHRMLFRHVPVSIANHACMQTINPAQVLHSKYNNDNTIMMITFAGTCESKEEQAAYSSPLEILRKRPTMDALSELACTRNPAKVALFLDFKITVGSQTKLIINII